MGLDICVRRLVKAPRGKGSKMDYFSMVDDNGEYNRLGFPEWTKEFERNRTESWYDWDKFKEETGIDINTMEIDSQCYGPDGCYMEVYPKGVLPEWNENYPGGYDAYEEERNKVIIKIDLDKVPTKKKKLKAIYWKEVGYQRKGLNSKFYDDYDEGKIGYWVWTKVELERYKEDYCDEESDYYDKPKEAFQKHIIDNFEEGKDCVIFSW